MIKRNTNLKCIECKQDFNEKLIAKTCPYCKQDRCINCSNKHYCSQKPSSSFQFNEVGAQRKTKQLKTTFDQFSSEEVITSPVNRSVDKLQIENVSSDQALVEQVTTNDESVKKNEDSESCHGPHSVEAILEAVNQSEILKGGATPNTSTTNQAPHVLSFDEDRRVATATYKSIDLTETTISTIDVEAQKEILFEGIAVATTAPIPIDPSKPSRLDSIVQNKTRVVERVSAKTSCCGTDKLSHTLEKSTTIGNFVLTDYDSTLSSVMLELFTDGYSVVQNQSNNCTFAFGNVYTKKCKGLKPEHGFFFIQALIVAQSQGNDDLSPLNFVFAKENEVKEFCESKDPKFSWDLVLETVESISGYCNFVYDLNTVMIDEATKVIVLKSIATHLQVKQTKSQTASDAISISSSSEISGGDDHDNEIADAEIVDIADTDGSSRVEALGTTIVIDSDGAVDQRIVIELPNGEDISDDEDFNVYPKGRVGRQSKRPSKVYEPEPIQSKTSSNTSEVRWKKALVAYKKLMGRDYVRLKGDRINVFEKFVEELEQEAKEKKDQEAQAKKEQLQEAKAKREREAKAKREQEAKEKQDLEDREKNKSSKSGSADMTPVSTATAKVLPAALSLTTQVSHPPPAASIPTATASEQMLDMIDQITSLESAMFTHRMIGLRQSRFEEMARRNWGDSGYFLSANHPLESCKKGGEFQIDYSKFSEGMQSQQKPPPQQTNESNYSKQSQPATTSNQLDMEVYTERTPQLHQPQEYHTRQEDVYKPHQSKSNNRYAMHHVQSQNTPLVHPPNTGDSSYSGNKRRFDSYDSGYARQPRPFRQPQQPPASTAARGGHTPRGDDYYDDDDTQWRPSSASTASGGYLQHRQRSQQPPPLVDGEGYTTRIDSYYDDDGMMHRRSSLSTANGGYVQHPRQRSQQPASFVDGGGYTPRDDDGMMHRRSSVSRANSGYVQHRQRSQQPVSFVDDYYDDDGTMHRQSSASAASGGYGQPPASGGGFEQNRPPPQLSHQQRPPPTSAQRSHANYNYGEQLRSSSVGSSEQYHPRNQMQQEPTPATASEGYTSHRNDDDVQWQDASSSTSFGQLPRHQTPRQESPPASEGHLPYDDDILFSRGEASSAGSEQYTQMPRQPPPRPSGSRWNHNQSTSSADSRGYRSSTYSAEKSVRSTAKQSEFWGCNGDMLSYEEEGEESSRTFFRQQIYGRD